MSAPAPVPRSGSITMGGRFAYAMVGIVLGLAALAVVADGYGLGALLIGLASLFCIVRATSPRQRPAAPDTARKPAPRSHEAPARAVTHQQVGAVPQRPKMPLQLERERRTAERLAIINGEEPVPREARTPLEPRPQSSGPKVTWTHPEVWAGDVANADLDADEVVRTATFAFNVPGGRPAPASAVRSTSSSANGSGSSLRNWQAAEVDAMEWMRRNGYSDASLTKQGADGGLDVVSRRAVAQVKHQRKPVGSQAIQRLKGAASSSGYSGREPLFFSAYGYSAQAMREAREIGVTLYQLDGGIWRRVVG